MRTKKIGYLAFLLLLAAAFSFSGCSKLFAPSDEQAINAINESGAYKDLNMLSPIVVLEKGPRMPDGTWPIKVKATFTYEIANKQMSPPVEKMAVFYVYKTKDSAGKTVWKRKL